MEEQDRSRSPSRRTSRVEQVVGRWLRRSRDLGSRSHSLSRDRVLVDGKMGESSASDQRNYPFRLTVQIQRDPDLHSHGLGLSSQTPILVQDVVPGGPADGRLVPGDQLVKINNVAIEDLTPGQAAEIIRECQDTVTMTVLRTMVGPKSSFITPEKRAKLKSNPVKVRFAEEVEVNGHSQGNALLFLPNVLKVYLENGQTKAFKFEPNTTVKDIVMTLKEKLSLSRIEHFSLALEQQYSATKMLLLHEEERIQQVVQKRESHDYRCLFRVCFVPKDPRNLLLDDPTTFDYLYLQGVNDVLQERFAVEMRCNTALRLAALHIQERLACCGQSPKTNLKTITKTWGIENFVSSTLLRNMREKDLRKAIGYHMKKSQSQQDPKQKGLSANQARISYLEELSDLKSFGGKSFSATMMLQDRESMVTLLVGARYGVSQVVNHKLNIMTTLTEFTSITRIELLPESDRVSLVKIYLQDIKPITLLLESVAAKDMSCLIAGYCRVFVDPNLNIFPWADETKKHRVSAEEGYVSRCGSDSDASTDTDMDPLETRVHRDDKPRPRMRSSSDPDGWKRKDRDRGRDKGSKEKGDKPWRKMREREEKDADTEKVKSAPSKNSKEDKDGEELGKEKAEEETAAKMDRTKDTGRIQIEITKVDSVAEEESVGFEDAGEERKEGGGGGGGGGGQVQDAEEPPSMSEASDSCRTDSRFLTSPSSDSLDALEEDDLISCSSSFIHPLHQAPSPQYSSGQLHPYNHTHPHPHLLIPPPAHSHPLLSPTSEPLGEGGGCRRSGDGADPHLLLSTPTSSDTACPMEQPCINPYSEDNFMCFAELSRCVDFLPSPPEASEEEDDEEEELRRRRMRLLELDESVRRAAEGVGGGGGGAEEDGVPKQSPHSGTPSLRTDFVFNFNQSDARCYYKLCSSVTPDSALSPPRPIPQPEEEQEREGEQAEAVDLEPIPILQPPPGFGDSSSDEEFFDARDRFASPEDPTSGALPRDFSAEMNPNLLRTLSLSDIGIFVADVEDEGQEKEDTEREPNEGGGRETLLQLRRRSRKRRSFMETNFTSRVTFPESDIVNSSANQNLVSNRIKINLQPQANNSQVLTSESDLPEQTQPPCPTVASLTHSEWEPAQLETKPIPSKSNGPGSLDDSGSCGQDRDPRANSRVTKQEMEMEPDAMESKSVTDLVKTASRSITVVRCRVEPDGKESTDRRGDGKEEGAGLEEGGDRKKQDFRVSENGPVFSHMLSEISEESDRCEETEDEETTGEEGTQGHLLNSEKLLEHVDEQIENNISATFSFDMNDNGIRVSPTLEIILAEQNPYADDFMSEQGVGDYFKPPSHSPPPPPPSSPLPQLPPVYKSQIHQVLLREQVCKKTMETSPKTLLSNSNSAELPLTKHKSSNGQEIDIEVKPVDNEDEASSIVSSVTTTSDEVIDSANSDNVFDDDEVSNPLNCSFSDNKAANNSDCPISTNTIGVDMDQTDTAGEPMSQSPPTMNIKDYSSSNITQIHSLHSDYASTINSITAKLGAATTVLSPTFTTGGPVNKEITTDTGLCTGQEIDKPMSGSLMPNVATRSKIISAQVNEVTTKNSFASLGKGNMVNDLSVEPPSPTRFLFQTCSPSIMSRLSASTLRGKIQRLPLFLSRSQENLNQAGLENVDDNPSQDISGDNTEITIKITDDDVTKTLDFELSTGEDMVDSDDSDNTITGSEADSDVVETISAEITHSTVYEEKGLVKRVVMSNENTPPPVQTEPTTISRTQPFSPGPYKDTPGPIVNPPGSIAGNVQGYTSDTKVDTPGPIKEAPESLMKVTSSNANVSGMEMNDQSPVIPTPIVVTTQTINGPGLSFHNKSEKVRMASSDRPLVGLCQPAAETSAPLKILSSGCGMCTICVDQSRAKTPAPLLKPDFGCRSVLASGCESVVGGIQMPLDACGCPMVYTNCFTGGDSFDDELTVYEFSCRTKNSGVAHTSGLGLPLMTTPPLPPFLSTSPPSFSSSTLSPSFPRSALFSSSTSELSPLLSPLADATDCFLSQTHKETISRLGQQRYPSPPAGFQTLRGDVDQLLTVLEGGGADRSVGGRGGRHLRDTCPAHFTENKRVLHLEARRLMTGCQKVVGVGQSSDEMLLSLADSFRHLVELAGVCLWFSGCDRCDRRNAEAVAGLADVARSFRDFCLAAERASGKRSCQDLSTKLLAKQCTALTASVFCLTQLFRTLTAL